MDFSLSQAKPSHSVVMDWGVASSQNTQGVKVVAVSAERPKVPTMGKTTDGRFVGENTGASLYRP